MTTQEFTQLKSDLEMLWVQSLPGTEKPSRHFIPSWASLDVAVGWRLKPSRKPLHGISGSH